MNQDKKEYLEIAEMFDKLSAMDSKQLIKVHRAHKEALERGEIDKTTYNFVMLAIQLAKNRKKHKEGVQ